MPKPVARQEQDFDIPQTTIGHGHRHLVVEHIDGLTSSTASDGSQENPSPDDREKIHAPIYDLGKGACFSRKVF